MGTERTVPLQPPVPIDTRALFRPVSASLLALLRGLTAAQWQSPTVAGTWAVRDVVAHLLDTALRRLSFHRDGLTLPPPRALTSEREFVGFINDLNAQWITASKRLSPRVLTDLYAHASHESADWFESLPLDRPALFPVSWAGEQSSEGWFDIGREFTELWHHQQQIRMAVGAGGLQDPRYLGAVIDVAMRGLPHAFRHTSADHGDTVLIDVRGGSGGQWTLLREEHRWSLWCGAPKMPTAQVRLTDDTAWRLLSNALPGSDAARAIEVDGRKELGLAIVGARSVIV